MLIAGSIAGSVMGGGGRGGGKRSHRVTIDSGGGAAWDAGIALHPNEAVVADEEDDVLRIHFTPTNTGGRGGGLTAGGWDGGEERGRSGGERGDVAAAIGGNTPHRNSTCGIGGTATTHHHGNDSGGGSRRNPNHKIRRAAIRRSRSKGWSQNRSTENEHTDDEEGESGDDDDKDNEVGNRRGRGGGGGGGGSGSGGARRMFQQQPPQPQQQQSQRRSGRRRQRPASRPVGGGGAGGGERRSQHSLNTLTVIEEHVCGLLQLARLHQYKRLVFSALGSLALLVAADDRLACFAIEQGGIAVAASALALSVGHHHSRLYPLGKSVGTTKAHPLALGVKSTVHRPLAEQTRQDKAGNISLRGAALSLLCHLDVTHSRAMWDSGAEYDEHLYNIQCSEIFTLGNEKLHTET